MFPKVSYIRPFLQLIKALDVARNGLPMQDDGYVVDSPSGLLYVKHNKVDGVVEYVNLYQYIFRYTSWFLN